MLALLDLGGRSPRRSALTQTHARRVSIWAVDEWRKAAGGGGGEWGLLPPPSPWGKASMVPETTLVQEPDQSLATQSVPERLAGTVSHDRVWS